MEENTKKKLFIITPQELAELGILDSLSNIKLKKPDGKSTTPTTKTNKLDPVQALRNAIKKKMTLNDKLVFKKPVEPGTSKVKKVHTEMLTEELELLNVVKKPTKVIKTKQKSNIVSNKKVPTVKCTIKSKTDKNESDVDNTTERTKGVSVISDTNVHFSKEVLDKIVGKISNPNMKNSLANIIQKQTVESKHDVQDTNTIINNVGKKSSRKNKHIPNVGGKKSKRDIKKPVAKATLQTCDSDMRKAEVEFNFVKPTKSVSKSNLTSFNNAKLEIKPNDVPTLQTDTSDLSVTCTSENTEQHKNKQIISNKTIEYNISSIPCKESNSAINYISTETEASHVEVGNEEASIKLPKRWNKTKVNSKVTIDKEMKEGLTEDVKDGGKQEKALIKDSPIDCIETRTSKHTLGEITEGKLLKGNINIIETASPVVSIETSHQKDIKNKRNSEINDKNKEKILEVTETAATHESASDKNTEDSPKIIDSLVSRISMPVIKKKVGRPKRQSINVSTEDVLKNTPVQNLLETIKNEETSIKTSKRRNKTVNSKVTIDKEMKVALTEDVKYEGKQEKVLIEDSPIHCIETRTSKQSLDEITKEKPLKGNINIIEAASPAVSVETYHLKDVENKRDVQKTDKNEEKILDVTETATTLESASDKNTEDSPGIIDSLFRRISKPVIKKKVGRPKRQSINVSTEDVLKNTPVQNLLETIKNEETSIKTSKRRNKTVNSKVTIDKEMKVALTEDVKYEGKQEKVLIEDSPIHCIETRTSKQSLDEITKEKPLKGNINIIEAASPAVSVETYHLKDVENKRDVQKTDKNEEKILDVTETATTLESASDKNTEDSPGIIDSLFRRISKPVIKKKVGRPKRQSINVSTEDVFENTPVQNLLETIKNEEASMKTSNRRIKTVNSKVTIDKEMKVALTEDVKDGGKQEKVLIEDSPIHCIETRTSKHTLGEITEEKLLKGNINIIETASPVGSVETSHQKDIENKRDVQKTDKNEEKILDVTETATTHESTSDENTEDSPGIIDSLVPRISEPVIKKKVGRPKRQSINVSTEDVLKNTPVQNLLETIKNEEASMKTSKRRNKTVNSKVTIDKEMKVALTEDVKDEGKQEKVLIEESPIHCIETRTSKQSLDEITKEKLLKGNINIIENEKSYQEDNTNKRNIEKNEEKTNESVGDKNNDELLGNINNLDQKTNKSVIRKKVGRPKKQSIHVSTQKASENTLEQENISSDCKSSEGIKKRKRSSSHSISQINKSHDDSTKKLEKDGDILTNVILQTEHCTTAPATSLCQTDEAIIECTVNKRDTERRKFPKVDNVATVYENNNEDEKYSDVNTTSVEPKTNIEIDRSRIHSQDFEAEKSVALQPDNDSDNVGSQNTVNNPNLEDPVTTAPKKKRGRKPKSECAPSPVQEKIELVSETSRSGRKRVKINYFEFDGRLAENIRINKKRKLDYPEIQDKPDNDRCSLTSNDIDQSIESTVPKKKRGRKPKIKCVQENIELSAENDRKRIELDDSEFKKTFESKPEDRTSTEPDNVASNLVTTDIHEDLATTLTPKETNLINVSFSKPIGRRGRPKKVPDYLHYAHRDDQNNVTCGICTIKVDFDEWTNHNETVHNNLGWILGESEVRLDDTLLLKNILNPLLSENKQLVCFKCKAVYTKVIEFISHKEECDGISCNGKVECAVCNELMVKEAWSKHKLKHNNLAWRIGDPPLDINNETVLIQILSKAKKPFRCEKCKEVKKSVLGFLSHRGQCGLSLEAAKISCEICEKRCLPSSMPTHMKQQHSGNKQDIDAKIQSDYFHVDLDVSLKKRKAATKALSILNQFSKGEKIEHFRYYVKQLNFDENKELIMFLNKELGENKVLVCKITGCEFVTETAELLLEHMNECPLKPAEYYACNKCYSICPNEDEIIKHLQQVHDCKIKLDDDYEEQNKSSTDEEDEEEVVEEFEEENFLKNRKTFKTSKIKNKIIKTKKDDNGLGNLTPEFVLQTSRKSLNQISLYSHAFHFTFEFCQTHFTATNLFKNFYSKSMDLVEENIQQYLPPMDVSCDVSEKIVKGFENVYSAEYNFKKFELFEVEKGDAFLTIFCGGPIRSIAWLPTPYTSLNELQILAVAIGQDFNGIYRVDENYTERTSIQFWNFGILKNRQDIQTPTFEFGLVFDYGPIWHMEWCPTGCFNPENNDNGSRIGLLAVAGSVMTVNVYSIPLIKKEETGLFYKLKPLLKLQLVSKESELKRTIFATKISWSKVSGCNSIAVGYSDGMVAIYNLKFTSSLLKFRDKNSIEVMLPHKIIKAHTHFISVLSWVPIEGDRLLVTSSYDKNAFVWDLFTEDKFMTKKKKILTDGSWLTNWLSFITANEETTLTNGCVTLTQYSHREYLNENCNVSYSTGTILTVSANDWLNGFIQANTVGEIVASFPHQMLFCQDLLKKGPPYRCLLGYTKLIDKTKSPEERTIVEKKKFEFLKPIPRNRASTTIKDLMRGKDHYDTYEPLDYQESIDQYGVLFCDIKPGNTHTLKWPSEQSEYSKPNLYPLQEINKISFNPNRQASLYYATGYQIGFIRLNYIKSLEKDAQINKSEISL